LHNQHVRGFVPERFQKPVGVAEKANFAAAETEPTGSIMRIRLFARLIRQPRVYDRLTINERE
jgi:hypothetical protein